MPLLVKMEVAFVVVLTLQLLASHGQAQIRRHCGKKHYTVYCMLVQYKISLGCHRCSACLLGSLFTAVPTLPQAFRLMW